MDTVLCTMCNFTTYSQKSLNYHIIRRHKDDSNFHVTCSFPNCFYSSKSWNGFKTHFSRKHRQQVDIGVVSNDEFNEEADQGIVGTTEGEIAFECANYALKLQTKLKVPASAVDDVIESTINLIRKGEELQKMNSDVDMAEVLKQFKTQKLRTNYITRNCNYLEPVEVVLGKSYHLKNSKLCEVNDCAYIVPFKEAICNYVNQPEVWEEITTDHSVEGDIMEDFCDGSHIKNNDFMRLHKPCLQFIINTDSMEVVNPIGAHVTKHKIDVFYWTIGNVRPSLRSKWSNIHLLAICKTRYLKKYGFSTVLKDFLDNLKELQKGVTFIVKGQEEVIYGVLVAVLCDTPAAAFLANMKQSVFANKFCRTCNIKTEHMQTKIRCQEFQERCPQLHRDRATDLEAMPVRLRPFWSKEWGINGYSPLLDLDYFNVAINMPHDPMHVLLEGLFGYATSVLLQICITERVFDLKWLNYELKRFPYSYLDRDNKPEIITRKQVFESVTTKQTAAGQLTLSYVLPHILHDQCENMVPYYKNYMQLVALICLCTSPYASKETAGEIQVMAEGYVSEFKNLYPTLGLRPKHHYLLHFAVQILRFGPLRNQWLFRFESKNNSFKNFKFKNFINLPLSMAKHHQMSACYSFLTSSGERSDNYLYSGDYVKEGQVINITEKFDDILREIRLITSDNNISTGYEVTELSLHGLKYKLGACLLESWEDNVPKFLSIEALLVVNWMKLAVCKILDTEEFVWQRNAFKVKQTDNSKVVDLAQLKNKWPLPIYDSFVTNRYCHFGQGVW